jgi:hypothetical protein
VNIMTESNPLLLLYFHAFMRDNYCYVTGIAVMEEELGR